MSTRLLRLESMLLRSTRQTTHLFSRNHIILKLHGTITILIRSMKPIKTLTISSTVNTTHKIVNNHRSKLTRTLIRHKIIRSMKKILKFTNIHKSRNVIRLINNRPRRKLRNIKRISMRTRTARHTHTKRRIHRRKYGLIRIRNLLLGHLNAMNRKIQMSTRKMTLLINSIRRITINRPTLRIYNNRLTNNKIGIIANSSMKRTMTYKGRQTRQIIMPNRTNRLIYNL